MQVIQFMLKCAVLSISANISNSFMQRFQYLWLFSNVSSANPDVHSKKYFHIYLMVFIRKHVTIHALNAADDLPLQFCLLCSHGLTRPFSPPHSHWHVKHMLLHRKTELVSWVWQLHRRMWFLLCTFSCTGECGFRISFFQKKKKKKEKIN